MQRSARPQSSCCHATDSMQTDGGKQRSVHTLFRLMPLSSMLRLAEPAPTAFTDSRQLLLSQDFWLLLDRRVSYCRTVPSSAADQKRWGLLGSTSNPYNHPGSAPLLPLALHLLLEKLGGWRQGGALQAMQTYAILLRVSRTAEFAWPLAPMLYRQQHHQVDRQRHHQVVQVCRL